jgi:cardiolipin synthase A/B
MTAWIQAWWLPALLAAATTVAAIHAVLNKRDVRSAIGWVGLILLVPGIGAVLYLILGINRISRAARGVRAGVERYAQGTAASATERELPAHLAPADAHLVEIARALDRATRRPLIPGNAIQPLRDGDQAYPAMLAAIDGAERTIALATYIFDSAGVGARFVDALAAAQARGVAVRVLIDDAGARYTRPSVDRLLRRRGVPVARFLRVWAPWSAAFSNLRNHRKLLVVDGHLGFTGGMNIRQHCMIVEAPPAPTHDLHFRVEGPVVGQLAEVFAEDWAFVTGERLAGEAWFPPLPAGGTALARGIPDGPDDDLDCMRWVLHAAIATARRTIRVMTPYFLPDEPLITALNVAALRGITVDVVLPARGNLRIVDWAMAGELWKVLPHGCRIWLTPGPFDHSKAMTVDGAWTLLGSANWDPRSLRLNFELGVEAYDPGLASRVDALIDERIGSARRLEAADLSALPWPVRLRNATARLLTPYL